MHNIKLKLKNILLIVTIVLLSACVTRPCCTDYIKVSPVIFVPYDGTPHSKFGWLEINEEKATAYKVEIGNKQYFDLLDRVGKNHIIEELAILAKNEVQKKGYCKEVVARTKNKGIFGPQTGEYVLLIAECGLQL